VDFHGVNVANATVIIKEILERRKSLISPGGFLATLFSWFNSTQSCPHFSLCLVLLATLVVAASLLLYSTFWFSWKLLYIFGSDCYDLKPNP
jgi:hypothetical protein